jgi:4a-hydroxytetrahydrobiopterin dehydratase
MEKAIQRLDAASRAKALAELAAWREVPGRDAIQRQFTFPDFNTAFGFMSRCASRRRKWTITQSGSMSTIASMSP